MKRITALLTGLLIGAPLITQKPLAAEWDRSAGLSLGAEYSDNICLSDTDKKARSFATVTPDVRLRGRGARASVSLSGSVKYNTLGESDFTCPEGRGSNLTNREAFLPSLRYFGDLELVENWLTLESDASARTTSIDPFAPGDTDSFDGRGNVNIVYQYGAGARIQRRLFDRADMRMRYYYNEQYNDARQLGDSSESRGEFDLGTDGASSRLSVGLSGRYSEVMYDGTDTIPAFDNKLSSAQARASLQLSSSWRISATVGEEWNQFISARPDIDGTSWDASLRWSPNERLVIEAGTGERFFGTTPRASIQYRHQRSELSASYNRTLTIPRDLRAADGRFDIPFDTGFGNDFDPDSDFNPGQGAGPGQFPGAPPTLSGEPTFIGNTPILNERLRLSYRYAARRTTLSVTATNSRQQRLEDLGEATFSAVGLRVSRSLSSKTSANMSVTWSEREGRGGNTGAFGDETETWRGVLGLNRRLGSNTTMSLSYRHTRRESDREFDRYTENRVILSARYQF